MKPRADESPADYQRRRELEEEATCEAGARHDDTLIPLAALVDWIDPAAKMPARWNTELDVVACMQREPGRCAVCNTPSPLVQLESGDHVCRCCGASADKVMARQRTDESAAPPDDKTGKDR